MFRLAARELISRRFATLLGAAGLATAVIGFVLLAGTTRTTEAQVSGDLARVWGGPYQLLVRPPGSATELEVEQGLVRPNAISGLYGGITEAQLAAVRAIPAVDVAAPIAVAGFVQWPAGIPLDLGSLAPSSGVTVLRVQTSIQAEAGLSQFPAQTAGYLVIASVHKEIRRPGLHHHLGNGWLNPKISAGRKREIPTPLC